MINKERALKIIFWISLAGVLFSGYMVYMETFKGLCGLGTCRVDIHIATLPACIYGLVMYLAIMIISCIGIKSKNNGNSNNNTENSRRKKL